MPIGRIGIDIDGLEDARSPLPEEALEGGDLLGKIGIPRRPSRTRDAPEAKAVVPAKPPREEDAARVLVARVPRERHRHPEPPLRDGEEEHMQPAQRLVCLTRQRSHASLAERTKRNAGRGRSRGCCHKNARKNRYRRAPVTLQPRVATGAVRGDPNSGNGLWHSIADSWREHERGSRYTARYLHFDGPNRMTVSPDMWIEQGFVLGILDDTGSSAWDHIHFQINDRTLLTPLSPFGRTTRPTPIDGPTGPQTLNDNDDNRCIISDNQITSPAAHCRALVRYLELDSITRTTLELLCGVVFGEDPRREWIRRRDAAVDDVTRPIAGGDLPIPRRP